jgi:lysophospholipase L1-like esterase
LRILPLGDSITWGTLSTDGNGYRQDLLDLLSGTRVQYIGSQRSGNMTNNFNEGHPGATIGQITGFANQSLPQRPNLILLMAGTNDMIKDVDPVDAPQRLGNLLDECLAACPDAVLVTAQLTPTTNATATAFMNVFNPAISRLAASRVSAGKKVMTIDMRSYVNTTELKDGLHPTDCGYNQMAIGWQDAIRQAISMGWITPPVAANGLSS